jgi:protease I
MTSSLQDRRIAFVVANEGIEQAELTEPWKAVEAAGGTPELIAPEAGEAQAFRHLDPADRFPVDRTTAAADPVDYDGLVLPGGVANADRIRTDPDAVRFVRELSGRAPVAVICHGPWILVEAGVLADRTLTSWPSLRTDLENAGARWVDERVHVDGSLISSRKPDDLPAFCEELVRAFAKSDAPETGAGADAGAPLAV